MRGGKEIISISGKQRLPDISQDQSASTAVATRTANLKAQSCRSRVQSFEPDK